MSTSPPAFEVTVTAPSAAPVKVIAIGRWASMVCVCSTFWRSRCWKIRW
jgi:hypothetical protein